MAKPASLSPTDQLIATLLKAREQAMALNEPMAAYLTGMAIKAIEDRQMEGVPPGWDDGIVDETASDGDEDDDGEDDPALIIRSAA